MQTLLIICFYLINKQARLISLPSTDSCVCPIAIVDYTYLLTYSTVQSPPWEANWFAASQEIPRISRNPKVHYRTHKRPPPISILDQPNPVHITTSHFLEIHHNIIHPSTPGSPQWSPSLRFPHQDPIHPLSSPIRATCYCWLQETKFTNSFGFHWHRIWNIFRSKLKGTNAPTRSLSLSLSLSLAHTHTQK